MANNRAALVEAADTVERLLDAYQLSPDALADPEALDPGQQATVATLIPVLDQLLDSHGVTLQQVVDFLNTPVIDTVAALVDLADQLLVGSTRATYMSSLRFMRDGWRIFPEELPDALAAAKQAELRVELPSDPAAYDTVEAVIPSGKRTATFLVLWPGYGDQPIERVRRAKVEFAAKYKRADTLTRAAVRDRKRAARGAPPLGWTADGAVSGLYAAMSYLFGLARGEGIVDATFDPLADVTKPGRGETNRRPQSPDEIDGLWRTVVLHAPDPQGDRLLLKFFFHTGSRRAGAINLTLGDLNRDRQSVTLTQKYGKRTEVPVARTLLDELFAHAHARGSTEDTDPVFRVSERDPATGALRPLSDRHFDTLHDSIHDHLAWAREEGWTVHWARHHAKAEMHDIGGPAVARRFMGHAPGHVTERYGPASFEQVAWAMSVRTGEPHPLAEKPWWLG